MDAYTQSPIITRYTEKSPPRCIRCSKEFEKEYSKQKNCSSCLRYYEVKNESRALEKAKADATRNFFKQSQRPLNEWDQPPEGNLENKTPF